MKQIPLTQGYVATVDDEDYERVSQFKWTATVARYKDGSVRDVYAFRRIGGRLSGKNVRLHRFILGITSLDVDVDHKNHNGLDCTRANLRPCTRSQNSANSRVNPESLSGFKGVTWHKRAGKWQVKIKVMQQQTYLGLFESPILAAQAYNEAARKKFGEFALLNDTRG